MQLLYSRVAGFFWFVFIFQYVIDGEATKSCLLGDLKPWPMTFSHTPDRENPVGAFWSNNESLGWQRYFHTTLIVCSILYDALLFSFSGMRF